MKRSDDIMQTTPVRIDNDVLAIVREYKSVTGIPIQRFIEDAIVEKVDRLPDEMRAKIGLHKSNKKKK